MQQGPSAVQLLDGWQGRGQQRVRCTHAAPAAAVRQPVACPRRQAQCIHHTATTALFCFLRAPVQPAAAPCSPALAPNPPPTRHKHTPAPTTTATATANTPTHQAQDYYLPDALNLSPECKSLLRQLLHPDHEQRIRMPAIMGDAWFRTDLPPDALHMNDK